MGARLFGLHHYIKGRTVAKIIIELSQEGKHVGVSCRTEKGPTDNATLTTLTNKIAQGLASHIALKMNDSLKSLKKGTHNVH